MNPNHLVPILQNLPPAGLRLSGGLALRLSHGNGMTVLGCSRIGVRPSTVEMEVIVQAVVAAFSPKVIYQAKEPEWRRAGDVYIWRLYWPVEEVEEVWRVEVVEQGSLFD